MSSGNSNLLDFHSQSVSFIPVNAQARHLVDHLVSSGNCWGKLHQEALWKAWWAEHASNEERWYNAIVSELQLRVVGAALAGMP